MMELPWGPSDVNPGANSSLVQMQYFLGHIHLVLPAMCVPAELDGFFPGTVYINYIFPSYGCGI